jgi:hypothetical protein
MRIKQLIYHVLIMRMMHLGFQSRNQYIPKNKSRPVNPARPVNPVNPVNPVKSRPVNPDISRINPVNPVKSRPVNPDISRTYPVNPVKSRLDIPACPVNPDKSRLDNPACPVKPDKSRLDNPARPVILGQVAHTPGQSGVPGQLGQVAHTPGQSGVPGQLGEVAHTPGQSGVPGQLGQVAQSTPGQSGVPGQPGEVAPGQPGQVADSASSRIVVRRTDLRTAGQRSDQELRSVTRSQRPTEHRALVAGTPNTDPPVANTSNTDPPVPDTDPRSYHEALNSPLYKHWKSAMQEEYASLVENNAFTLVKHSESKPIGCKWVFKTKHYPDGTLRAIVKARLVIK